MKKKATKSSATDKQEKIIEDDANNVNKIRDILFGNQVRDFDNRFMQFEKSITADLDNLRQENKRQIESLQSFVESEFEVLSTRISGEEKSRIDELENLNGSLSKSVKQIDKKMADAGKTIDSQFRENNQKILKQSQDFNSELHSQIEQTRKRADDSKQELASGKVDKTILAEMLTSLALQMNTDS